MSTTRSRTMTLLIVSARIAALCFALYVLALTWLWFRQEKLIFAPTILPADFVLAKDPDVHEVAIDVPGARLSALHMRLPNPKGVVFFLHGNGGALDSWFVKPAYYRAANYDLFMLDYRGYGKSTGKIESEEQLRADVRAAWALVAPQYIGRKVVIYGRSLGSGLAAGLAAEMQAQHTPADLTVMVSSYSSMAALASETYPLVPQFVQRYPMRSDQRVGRIQTPLLLIHGEQDTMIPPRHSDLLKTLAPHATLVHVPGAAHNDLQDFDVYLNAFAKALADL